MTTARITFPARTGAAAQGELALPEGTDKVPAIVLIQEWWGINDHIRSMMNRFVHQRFLVLAPDLYHGVATRDPAEASKLMTELDGYRSVEEIAGAVRYAATHERCNGKVGVIGFCMGGAFSFRAVANIPEVAAAVPFYGIPRADTCDFAKVRAPILAHFASRDEWASADKARAIKEQIEKAGHTSMELCVYEADHAFVNDTRPEVYAPEAAKLALDRTYAFLHQHLD